MGKQPDLLKKVSLLQNTNSSINKPTFNDTIIRDLHTFLIIDI